MKPAAEFAGAERVPAGIRTAATSENSPLRLALGTGAVISMREALTARLADLDRWAATTDAVSA